MSYDSCSLTTPDIKWLGLRPSDFERYSLPEQCLLPMSDKDIKVESVLAIRTLIFNCNIYIYIYIYICLCAQVGQDMLKEDFIQKNPAWVAELELMLKLKQKAEIQALSSFGFQFVTQVYLPRKL